MRSDKERLKDILSAINQIDKYKNYQQFSENKLIKIWIIHHLLIIGEACSQVSDLLKNQYPDVPWNGPIDVRNMIAHEYFRIDFNIIWNIVDRNLLSFKKQIQKLLDDIE
jgi:uncharacterized protein with HEPN domain